MTTIEERVETHSLFPRGSTVSLERTAYHEAGHAVMVQHFGDKIDRITIRFNTFDNYWEGDCDCVPATADNENEVTVEDVSKIPRKIALLLVKNTSIRLAGLLTEYLYERKYKGLDKIDDCFLGFNGDGEAIESFKRELPQQMREEFPNLVKDLIPNIIGTLEDQWSVIEAIAKILIQEKKLSSDVITKIIDRR